MISLEKLYLIYKEHPIVFTDSRKANSGGIFFALKGVSFDGNDFAVKAIEEGADYAVVDRIELADTPQCIYVNDVLTSLQQLANYHRRKLTIPILAITGTNGKTTSKELIAEVLGQKYNVLATKGNLNNHIGVPLTLLEIQKEHQIAIVEMGANHPGEIKFLCSIAEPDYGLITNVGKAHLEGFVSFEGVIKTKSELYRYIESKHKAIFINIDNTILNDVAGENLEKLTFAINNPSAQLIGEIANNDLFLVAKILFPKGWLYIKTNLTGKYNLENILAAARVGIHFNVDPLLIQKGIENYHPTNKRSQVLKKDNTTFIVDCYNANPSSMVLAIQNFIDINKTGKVLILGDMLELGVNSIGEHQKIIELLKKSDCKDVFLIGQYFQQTIAPVYYKKFLNVDEFLNTTEQYKLKDKFILIKGSRGISLEKVIDAI